MACSTTATASMAKVNGGGLRESTVTGFNMPSGIATALCVSCIVLRVNTEAGIRAGPENAKTRLVVFLQVSEVLLRNTLVVNKYILARHFHASPCTSIHIPTLA